MLTTSTKIARRLWRDDRGLESVEYAILIGLVVVGALAAMAAIGAWVLSVFQDAQAALGA